VNDSGLGTQYGLQIPAPEAEYPFTIHCLTPSAWRLH
jgi:hypothetical protein